MAERSRTRAEATHPRAIPQQCPAGCNGGRGGNYMPFPGSDQCGICGGFGIVMMDPPDAVAHWLELKEAGLPFDEPQDRRVR